MPCSDLVFLQFIQGSVYREQGVIVQSGEEKRSRRTAVCRCGGSFEEAEKA